MMSYCEIDIEYYCAISSTIRKNSMSSAYAEEIVIFILVTEKA